MSDEARVYLSSLYEDRKIVIDGKEFKQFTVNKDRLAKLEQARQSEGKTAYDMLAVLIDAPVKFLETLDIRLIQKIFDDLVKEYRVDLGISKEEKKEPGPGETSSQG